MNFLKKASIPWLAFVILGIFSVSIGGISLIGGNVMLGIITLDAGVIVVAVGMYIIGRISSFVSIENESRKQKQQVAREKT